jgi:nitroreductase
MDTEEAIRSRRTVKAFDPRPVDRRTLEELLELARWAPNHNLTNPWRFRVVGPRALDHLKQAAGELAAQDAPAGADVAELARVAAAKLDRAPTLVVVSVKRSEDEIQDEEDLHAAAVAAYIVLLGAHARGLAGYWRTPAVLRGKAGRAAVGLPADERFVGLLYLGHARQTAETPGREPIEHYAEFLD